MRFLKLARKIEKIDGVEIIGYTGPKKQRYPMFKIVQGEGPDVTLGAGEHGDEPGGVDFMPEFFSSDLFHRFKTRLRFNAFPCINPWGYDHFRHGNHRRFNLNRECTDAPRSEEILLIIPHLRRSLFFSDHHETMSKWERTGAEPRGRSPNKFFLYETCEDKQRRIGPSIIQGIEAAGFSVCKWRIIGEDRNNGGVIWYPEDIRAKCYKAGNSLDEYMIRKGYTEHSFTIETPQKAAMKHRIAMNMIAMRTILERCT